MIPGELINIMKLAEALVERADLNRKIKELRERILRNAKYQEGESPSEEPAELIKEFVDVSESFEKMVCRINNTNNSITLDNGMTMIEALSRRDVLKLKHSLYKDLATEATPKQDRYSKKEIKFISAVSVKETQEQADVIAKEYRGLDAIVQQVNWNAKLI